MTRIDFSPAARNDNKRQIAERVIERQHKSGFTIGLTMIINLTLAPVLAVVIPNLIYKRHLDPALGAGPVATIIQDLISLIVYFLIASVFLL
jgi:Mg/Co/Ni transporter MgtE